MNTVRTLSALWAVAILALVVTLPGAPLASAQPPDAAGGTIGIRIGDGRVGPDGDPRAQIYIVDHVPPGSELTRELVVTNGTNQTQTVDVYPGPAAIEDGVFVVADKGRTSALTSWTDVGQTPVVIGSGEEAVIPVRITVPPDAPEGEFYGVVWAAVATGTDANGITSISRVGVRIYLSVGEGNGPAADFSISELTTERAPDGTAVVVAHVVNTGGRAVDLNGSLDLTDGPGGLSASTVESQVATIAPATEGRVLFELSDSASLPAGPWNARVQLTSGFKDDARSETVTFPDAGSVVTDPDEGVSWLAMVGAIAAIGLALVLVVVGVRAATRRGRSRAEGSPRPDVADRS
ncbi:hypothetical protein [Dietzia sp. Alg238-R159]|uniref:hypothetical protein n=1 Tax=Dietzia sp. Alg238-R159 TaxID=2305986 RepID=UPI0013D38D6D|nr:hypothetical protein [Dietzia sp. Alg238-R159]